MTPLRIRAAQVPTIAPQGEAFVARASEHLRACFPAECGELDDESLRELVLHGLTKAIGYGIWSQQDVCKLLNLMCTFGRDFDLDPSLPWARPYLEDAAERGPTLQINRLYRLARSRIDEARGLGGGAGS
ncbi:MAG: hypothetical protein H6712_32125 [Myxococcales bacterium]|nr:hypothetical protein [Myxococcales bacterium]MCB9718542.1 hypothetical protein [Myxococcales bacterium]